MLRCLILSSLELGWLVAAGAGVWLLAWEVLEGWAGLLPLPRGWLAREDMEGWINPSLLPGGWLALGWMLAGTLKPLAG